MPALDLVYNPVSGSFSDDHLEALRNALIEAGFRVTPMPTTAAGARLSGEADLVCVHGGDGTLRDTVQALGERAGSMPICVAPSGTINLVARELGYPRSPQRFAGELGAIPALPAGGHADRVLRLHRAGQPRRRAGGQ